MRKIEKASSIPFFCAAAASFSSFACPRRRRSRGSCAWLGSAGGSSKCQRLLVDICGKVQLDAIGRSEIQLCDLCCSILGIAGASLFLHYQHDLVNMASPRIYRAQHFYPLNVTSETSQLASLACCLDSLDSSGVEMKSCGAVLTAPTACTVALNAAQRDGMAHRSPTPAA